jgi:hypothetical protein
MTPDPNDNKIMTKRVQASDRASVLLSYSTREAKALRDLANSFTLKGKKASLSLLSRRSLQVYQEILNNPLHRANEEQILNKMVTPVPVPAPFSTRKTTAA